MRARLVPFAHTDDVSAQWRELAARALEPNPFAEPVMLGPTAAGLPDGDDARLLVVDSGDRLVFALPVVPRRSYRRVPLRAMTTWRHPYLSLGTPLVDADRPDEAWAAALGLLRDSAPWVALEYLALDGPVAASLFRCLAPRTATSSRFDEFDRAVVRRRPVADYAEGRISARHLKAIRRQRRRLAETHGEVRVVDLATTDRWREGVDALLATERAGWKGRDGGAVACHDGHAAWFRDMAAAMHDEGRLQLFALCAGDQPLAYQLNVVAGTTVFHLRVAYDERFASASPGLQLELEMLTEFHDDVALEVIDSCTEAGARVSEQLYPDRVRMGTVLVGASVAGRAAVRALPPAAAGYDRMRRPAATTSTVVG